MAGASAGGAVKYLTNQITKQQIVYCVFIKPCDGSVFKIISRETETFYNFSRRTHFMFLVEFMMPTALSGVNGSIDIFRYT